MRRLWILALAGLCACFYGCMYVSGTPEEHQSVRLTALDVGQGLAVLLEREGRFALYDFGPDSVGVVDALVRRGVDTLEWVVLSHFHRDHIGGFLELLGRGVFVRRLYVGSDTVCGFYCDSVFRVAQRLGVPVDTLVRGERVWFGGARFDVLWPTGYAKVEGNGASLVLLGRYGAGSVLLTGDLDSLGERRLLEMNPTLSAELLQVAHHGSAGSNTLRFLSQVSPVYAFVSVGAGNSYGHPVQSVVRKLDLVLGDSAKLFRTDLQGSVTFELDSAMGVVRD
ncbi:MAG: MBL fold metallo-hydrolase [Fibrobacter sp.]|nr:MBL fold metallo-hydrolase [Fibrobacter sp.]